MHFPQVAAIAIAVVLAFLAITFFCLISACAPRLAAKVDKDTSGQGLEEDGTVVLKDTHCNSGLVTPESQSSFGNDINDKRLSSASVKSGQSSSRSADVLPTEINEDLQMEFELSDGQEEGPRRA